MERNQKRSSENRIQFSDDLSHSLIPSQPYHSAQFFFLLVLPMPGLKLLVGSSLR